MAEPRSITAELQATSPGAVWRRVDLHLHSPGVPGFTSPSEADPRSQKGRTHIIEAYVAQLDAAKIEIGAITDYNAIHAGWFDPLRESAEAAGIRLLPGVELAFNIGKYGLHVLAVFDQETEAAAVNAFLQWLDRDPSQPLAQEGQEHRHIDCRTNLTDTLKQLREKFNCLLIPAHPDQKNGLIKTFSAADAAGYRRISASTRLEHCPERACVKFWLGGLHALRVASGTSCVEHPRRLRRGCSTQPWSTAALPSRPSMPRRAGAATPLGMASWVA